MSNRSPGRSAEPSAAGKAFFGVLGFFVVPALMAWHGIKLAGHWVWKAPRFVQVILALVVVGIIAGGAFVVYKRAGGRAEQAVNAEWKKFEVAARGADGKELLAVLDGILEKDPANRDALSRKAAIESGEAEPADLAMLTLMLRIHLKSNRTADAVREAKKLLVLEPKDWIANCILGQDALRRKDDAAVDRHLAVISDPQLAGTRVDLGGLIYALELFRQAGKDPTHLRTFALNRVVPNLRNPNLATIPPAGRAQLLACYVDTCLNVQDASVPSLLEYWMPAAKLADGSVEDAREASNTQVLSQFGSLQPAFAGALARFKKQNLLSDEDYNRLSKDVDERARRIWAATREIDPTNPAGYVGEAETLLRAGELSAAHQLIMDGERACKGWNIPLLFAYTAWAKATKQADKILPQLLAAANKFPDSVPLWQLVADTAEASNRRDTAIEAIQKAREKVQNNTWLIWTEARLWLDADMFDKALELLTLIPEKDRNKSPALIRAYVRALAGTGADSKVPAFARQMMNEAERANDPALALAPALGLLDSPATRDRALLADEIADRARVRWPMSLEAVQARARARVRAAEEDTPRWSAVRVEAAVDSLNLLKTRASADPWAPAMLAWVRYMELKAKGEEGGQGLDKAWSELTPILHMEKDPTLPADVLEAIGTLYYAKGQYDGAIRVLTRAAEAARQKAGPLLTLALAYYKNKDVRKGREVFLQTRDLPKSERVREEYNRVAQIITQE